MSRQLQLKMTGVARLRMNEPETRFSEFENDTWHTTTEETSPRKNVSTKMIQRGMGVFKHTSRLCTNDHYFHAGELDVKIEEREQEHRIRTK